ncbi:protein DETOXIFICATION 42 [Physcomitrium patens]|uniref:Protein DETOXIFICATION n=1 Tax=Physcomitrium patens TaxID=3218 RepID=A0A2K1KFT5_PHYPA|nr:protein DETOXIFICATION 42-like [Physcomitrium patens]XP_024379002.1 protein DETOXIFICATION 42-like [Physcomitrium patens]XP_024379004.1 protein DETOXIFICATION 42-like [Physcomitrium patens]XP_024379005.1 protein DETOXIFICATION 42-like [Physcomitrium patens]XP_024379006.1 protein DETOXIFICATION 42-like [Physcomitrium patens]XP_024379007.1 protein DETOXIFICATION 42-like [Physcomitrium patens]XP_024379008.1 protein DETOXIFICATION 42-like [Physcomitrium patens]XP_024379009.1 protein DETOXIFIC|eukprot:XP_024379001.1 protein DETOXIFICATION 42-like [Physcomitrella patens]
MSQVLESLASLRLRSPHEIETSLIDKPRHPLIGLFENLRNVFKADELGVEIATIALPAFLALASDPLASLVDTAFIGHIGPVELAAVGVSISVFNLVSKMFNLPLLNITTSFVAEDASEKEIVTDLPLESVPPDATGLFSTEVWNDSSEQVEILKLDMPKRKPCLPSVSSALVLGAFLGLGEALILAILAGPILTVMGIDSLSPMRLASIQYLRVRAIGAPAMVLALAIQGAFRGFKDTKTPLYATMAGNAVNIVLDPILIFTLKLGVNGAAIATVISQYVILAMLFWVLARKVTLLPPRMEDLRLGRFLKSGGYLLARTMAILLVMTLATSMAARQGAIQMAGHQICLQIWLAASLLSDSIALAGQAIIATAFASFDYKRVKEASFRILQIGFLFGAFVAVLLGATMPTFSKLFTIDVDVLNIIKDLIVFVSLTQPINSLAFVFDGLHYGASDFAYAALSMIMVAIPSAAFLIIFPPLWGILAVWAGLTLIMSLRLGVGLWRIGTATGPWKFLKDRDIEKHLFRQLSVHEEGITGTS